ncbi:amino acid ABC transporter substrate-binding protein [Litchfieldella qijiaojingensis]|uniref:Amino acid ABC transporter substrate-binding protein n=1 Tax=Litchfieldella qijiaojingensis TaxID=980347 RepID=A0ABQ2YIK4_9GAMM|nr:transporter substrate-binding domain-containing protein [Halomonas qijiaojingensis]GGX84229.1 amino acid ABC transporter substrate-binding protein [Halomonas qijiaojingensis]
MRYLDRGFKSMKGILAAGLFAVTSLGAAVVSQPVQADALSEIEQRGTLRVAVPQDFPPFGLVGTDLQPRGYDIDMANYLAEEMGVKLELVTVTSANRIPFLQTRQVDLVISSLGKNPEREAMIDFSDAYAPFFLGVFGTDEAAPLDSVDELAGMTIGVSRGSVEDMELSDIAPTDTTINRFEDNATTIAAFLSGQVDYIATGNVVAAEIAERYSDRAPTLIYQLKDSPCYVGMNKEEPALMAKVNELVAQALEDGTLESLSQKWLHASLPDNFGM